MSKYDPLYSFLSGCKQTQIRFSFSELERILGDNLPQSAYTYAAWWANGGHKSANAWLDAGYKVDQLNLVEKTVTFVRNEIPLQHRTNLKKRDTGLTLASTPTNEKKVMSVCGYEFRFVQRIEPLCDINGNIIKFYPQEEYKNDKKLQLTRHGEGAFCRFSIKAEEWSGVYLWVVDGVIIYIGETENLHQRFNIGYGKISPRNCYAGGQSTNCKMNKIVLELFQQGKRVDLFFHKTENYKNVELDLLQKISTLYNVKNNI